MTPTHCSTTCPNILFGFLGPYGAIPTASYLHTFFLCVFNSSNWLLLPLDPEPSTLNPIMSLYSLYIPLYSDLKPLFLNSFVDLIREEEGHYRVRGLGLFKPEFSEIGAELCFTNTLYPFL